MRVQPGAHVEQTKEVYNTGYSGVCLFLYA